MLNSITKTVLDIHKEPVYSHFPVYWGWLQSTSGSPWKHWWTCGVSTTQWWESYQWMQWLGAEISEDVRTPRPVSPPIIASKQPFFSAGVNIHTALEPPATQPPIYFYSSKIILDVPNA